MKKKLFAAVVIMAAAAFAGGQSQYSPSSNSPPGWDEPPPPPPPPDYIGSFQDAADFGKNLVQYDPLTKSWNELIAKINNSGYFKVVVWTTTYYDGTGRTVTHDPFNQLGGQ